MKHSFQKQSRACKRVGAKWYACELRNDMESHFLETIQSLPKEQERIGKKLFIDCAVKKLHMVVKQIGQLAPAEVFAAILSNINRTKDKPLGAKKLKI